LKIYGSGLAGAVLCSAAILPMQPVLASDVSGGSDGPAGGNSDLVLAVGATLAVATLLILDILHDSRATQAETTEAVPLPEVESTGVDWSSVESVLADSTIVVAVAPCSPDLDTPAGSLLGSLEEMAPHGVTVVADLLDLGGATGPEAFGMASEFFGASRLVLMAGGEDDPELTLISARGVLWEGLEGPDQRAAADSILTALWNSPAP